MDAGYRAVHYYIILFLSSCAGLAMSYASEKEEIMFFIHLRGIRLGFSYHSCSFLCVYVRYAKRTLPPGHLPSLITLKTSWPQPKSFRSEAVRLQSPHILHFLLQVFFFAAPPGIRLNLRGSFLDMRDLSRVPLPPSQKPWPFLPTSPAWQRPQSSGR